MRSASGGNQLRGLRDALRRAAAVVMLMLFASQTAAAAFARCEDHAAGGSSATSDAMTQMDHSSNAPHTTDSQSPRRNSGCDSSAPGSGCCILAGCATFDLAASVLIDEALPPRLVAIPAPAAQFVSPDIAPDVPPPRA